MFMLKVLLLALLALSCVWASPSASSSSANAGALYASAMQTIARLNNSTNRARFGITPFSLMSDEEWRVRLGTRVEEGSDTQSSIGMQYMTYEQINTARRRTANWQNGDNIKGTGL